MRLVQNSWREYELRWKESVVRRDGFEWDVWGYCVWQFRFCWPWFERFWYDGQYTVIQFGFGSLVFGWGDNYYERRNVEAEL